MLIAEVGADRVQVGLHQRLDEWVRTRLHRITGRSFGAPSHIAWAHGGMVVRATSLAAVAGRDEIIAFCDDLLDAGSFEDYGPNGLQVPGSAEVTKVATGVTANLELLERAADSGAELVLAHHGLLWGDQASPLSVPMTARLRALLCNDMSLGA